MIAHPILVIQPVLPIVAGVAAGAAAVPLINAASDLLRSPMGYPLNITIVLADDGHDVQVGKFEIRLHTLLFKQKLKMNHIELSPGGLYSFFVYSEYEIGDMRYVELEWKKRSWTDLLSSWGIHVNHIILDPMYIQDPSARAASVKRLCARQVPFNLWHKEDVDFSCPCQYKGCPCLQQRIDSSQNKGHDLV